MLHLVLEFNEEAAGNLAYCSLSELLKGVALGLAVNLLEFLLEDWSAHFKGFGEGPLEALLGVLLSSLALRLADVGPGSLDVGHCAAVDCVDIAAGQVVKHVSTELLAVHNLGFNAVDDLASQAHELLHELGSQLLDGNLLE